MDIISKWAPHLNYSNLVLTLQLMNLAYGTSTILLEMVHNLQNVVDVYIQSQWEYVLSF